MDALIDFTAGTLGGVANVYSGQPLDTVKVKMQAYPQLYRNAFGCFWSTARREGVRGLYAGTTPALLANVAENAFLFSAYGLCQKTVAAVTQQADARTLPLHLNAVAGGMAGFFVAFILCPLELVKCRLQAMYESQPQPAPPGAKRIGPLRLTAQILRQEGVLTLYKGLRPTMVRESPGYLVFFGAIEATRELLTKPGQSKEDLGLGALMLSGGVGGVTLWVAVFPFDVVKSRIQIMSRAGQKEPAMIATMMQIARQEGLMALYSGLLPTVIRSFVATACLYSTYTFSKRLMNGVANP